MKKEVSIFSFNSEFFSCEQIEKINKDFNINGIIYLSQLVSLSIFCDKYKDLENFKLNKQYGKNFLYTKFLINDEEKNGHILVSYNHQSKSFQTSNTPPVLLTYFSHNLTNSQVTGLMYEADMLALILNGVNFRSQKNIKLRKINLSSQQNNYREDKLKEFLKTINNSSEIDDIFTFLDLLIKKRNKLDGNIVFDDHTDVRYYAYETPDLIKSFLNKIAIFVSKYLFDNKLWKKDFAQGGGKNGEFTTFNKLLKENAEFRKIFGEKEAKSLLNFYDQQYNFFNKFYRTSLSHKRISNYIKNNSEEFHIFNIFTFLTLSISYLDNLLSFLNLKTME